VRATLSGPPKPLWLLMRKAQRIVIQRTYRVCVGNDRYIDAFNDHPANLQEDNETSIYIHEAPAYARHLSRCGHRKVGLRTTSQEIALSEMKRDNHTSPQ
jgi:hypothetical protein